MKQLLSFSAASEAAGAADEKQGLDIVAFDVREKTTVTEVFLFIGGNSHIHVKALEDTIRDRLKKSDIALQRTDGKRGHLWRVLDYGSLIIHIMDQATREFYSLERLWAEGRKINLKKKPLTKKRKKKPAKKKVKRKKK